MSWLLKQNFSFLPVDAELKLYWQALLRHVFYWPYPHMHEKAMEDDNASQKEAVEEENASAKEAMEDENASEKEAMEDESASQKEAVEDENASQKESPDKKRKKRYS